MFTNFQATTIAYDSTEKSIKLTASASNDPGVFFNAKSSSLATSSYKYIVVTYKTTKNASSQLFLQTSDRPSPSANFKVTYSTQYDNKYHSRIIDLTSNASWTGTINGFRFDYFGTSNANEVMYIDSIVFCKSQEDANYIKWERENIRNNPGVFIACEEMVRLFSDFHMCSAKYDSTEEAIVLTAESNVCKTTATNGSHISGGWTCALGFDTMVDFSVDGTIIDNQECEMEGIKGETVNKTLYAVWRENSDYIVYIPSTLKIEESNSIRFDISADIEYFVDSASISIVVNGIEKFVLEENDEITLDYEIRDSLNKNIYENNDVITTFSPNDSSDKKFEIEIMEDARYSGKYNEILNFTVNYSSGT